MSTYLSNTGCDDYGLNPNVVVVIAVLGTAIENVQWIIWFFKGGERCDKSWISWHQ